MLKISLSSTKVLKEEDPSIGKILEGGTTFRFLCMQKFRPKWLPSGEGKEE